MKRSDMLKDIEKALSDRRFRDPWSGQWHYDASDILEIVESLGMLPPERTRPATEYEKKIGTDKNSFLGIKVENTWEPEE